MTRINFRRVSQVERRFLAVCRFSFVAVVMMTWASATHVQAGTFQLLHSFDYYDIYGNNPNGSLIQNGSTLYGMTNDGGLSDDGTIFSIGTNGSGFQLLHSFNFSYPNDGRDPEGSLIQDGSTLYGMTPGGGLNDAGTIFSVGTDLITYQLLHSFDASVTSDGGYPNGSLIQDGSTLYGMTGTGGLNGQGTIFSIGTDGSGFQLLHSFDLGDTSNGRAPTGSLIQDGSTLYGMTSAGGLNGVGTVFSISTDGSGFQLLHSFETTDGSYPYDSLIRDGATLYGMTESGGENLLGTIFSIGTDGNGFQLLHSFDSSGGEFPTGSLIQDGSTLYGTTTGGGLNGAGTLFSIGTNGSGFQLLHSFDYYDTSNGSNPDGSLIQDGSTLYGMTLNGGLNDAGTIFAYTVPEPSGLALALIATLTLVGCSFARRRQ